MISRESYQKWVEANPKFSTVSFQKFKSYYRLLREEIFQCILDNPSGVDLPFYMGNLSVKVLDIEFKCVDDYPKSFVRDKVLNKMVSRPFITTDIPKRIKIVWKKHFLFKSLASVFGVEACRTFKTVISAGVRNNLHRYEKAFKYDKTPSKCEDLPKVSLFDIA